MYSNTMCIQMNMLFEYNEYSIGLSLPFFQVSEYTQVEIFLSFPFPVFEWNDTQGHVLKLVELHLNTPPC